MRRALSAQEIGPKRVRAVVLPSEDPSDVPEQRQIFRAPGLPASTTNEALDDTSAPGLVTFSAMR